MTKMREQIERAYEVLDFIEKRPDKHDQAWWLHAPDAPRGLELFAVTKLKLFAVTKDVALESCGTTACFAGWTVLLAGETAVNGSRLTGMRWLAGVAAQLLGLDDDEEDALFYKAKTLDEVRDAVTVIFGPRPSGSL